MSYSALHQRAKRLGDIGHALAMLSWDEAVAMPTGGGAVRADALATLEDAARELLAAPETGDLLASARDEDLDPWQAANVALLERQRRRALAVPSDLAIAHSKACSACEQAWRRARAENDWPAVADKLAAVVDLTRQKAAALGDALRLHPYDALLDEYEPGLERKRVDAVFAELAAALPPLIDRALGRESPTQAPKGPFPHSRQAALGRALMTALGFDFERGRLDVSHHPFCGGEPDDTRITTRYDEDDFLKSMFAVLHETGHALYQQGLPAAWRGQPVGAAGGMALHESQSLTMEMQVCRSRAFLAFAAPLVQRHLLGAETQAAEWQPDNLWRLATTVQRSAIRVDADELTYPLHVILRYELETALLDGSLAVADLPEAWRDGMIRLLGVDTADDFADGVMQDVHWYGGLLGYFPCYTLGAVMAAQIYRSVKAQVGDVEDAVRAGDFRTLLDWLRSNIHAQGSREPTLDLLADATGAELGTAAFLDHLRARYGG